MPLPPTAFAAAIVDLDGTMVDTAGDFERALHGAMTDLGRRAPGLDFVRRTIGKGSEHLVERALAEVGAPADALASALARYQHHYGLVNGRHSSVYPGVVDGLNGLRAAGLRLACVTNKPGAFALELLQRTALAPFFAHCFGGDAFERKKPHPLPLQRACAALGALPARTLVVGDSSNDAAAARAAGCPVVLVRYGYNHGEPIESVDADAFVDRLDALPALLRAAASPLAAPSPSPSPPTAAPRPAP